MISSTLKIISAASAAETNACRFTLKDSVMPRAIMSAKEPFSISIIKFKKFFDNKNNMQIYTSYRISILLFPGHKMSFYWSKIFLLEYVRPIQDFCQEKNLT